MIRTPRLYDIVTDKRDKEYIEWEVIGVLNERPRWYFIWRSEKDGRIEHWREIHKRHLKLIRHQAPPPPPFEIDWKAMKKYFKK